MTEIAHGTIGIEVNDREALANLRRLDAEYEKTMREIDAKEADVKISGDLSQLKRDLREADARLKEWEAKKAKAEGKALSRSDAAKMGYARREQKRLQDELAGVEQVAAARKKENDALKLTEARLKATHKLEADREKVIERSRKASERRDAAEARAANIRERAMLREQTLEERATQRRNREIAEVPKLEAAYGRLQQRLEKLDNVRRKARGDDRATALVKLDIGAVQADLERVRNEVRRRVGRDPVGIPINLTPGRDTGTRLRNELTRHGGDISATLASLGARGGERLGEGIVRGFSQVRDRKFHILADAGRAIRSRAFTGVGDVGTGALHKLNSLAQGLSNLTVRLGPFTATIRQAIVGASVLAPIILDLVGALGSLVSVAGSAALGIGALGIGLAGGAIPAAIGMVAVLKPVVGEFKNAMKASKAYNDAVLQYGKGSDQAAKKQKILTNVLRGVDDQTRAAFQNAGRLSGRWKDLTKSSRADAFHTMGLGLTFLNQNLDTFGHKTNDTFKALDQGLTGWISGLNSAEGLHILTTMWDNFNRSIAPVMHGLGQIAVYLGRVGAIASGDLPGLARSFDQWATGIRHTSDNFNSLDQRVQRTVQSAKDVGRFFMASGRLIKAFFSGGVSAGDSFVNTMTRAMNRWTEFLNTDKGQGKLKTFFSESVAGAQALWSVLAPLVSSFVGWAAEIAPFSRAFFSAAGAVGNVVSSLLKLTVLRGPLTAMAATLGALWSVNKISTGARALAGFVSGLTGVGAAGQRAATAETELAAANERSAVSSEAAAVAAGRQAEAYGALAVSASRAGGASTLAGAGGMGGGVRGAAAAEREAAAAERAAASTSRLGRIGKTAGAGLLSFGTTLTGLGPAGLAAAGGLLAAGGGAYYLWKRSQGLPNALKDADKAAAGYNDTLKALPAAQEQTAGAATSVVQAQLDLANATHDVNKAQKDGKDHGRDYQQLLLNQRSATLNLRDAQNRLNDSSKVEDQNRVERKKHMDDEVSSAKKALSIAKAQADAAKRNGVGSGKGTVADPNAAKRTEALANAQNRLNTALARQRAAEDQNTLASLNHQRALKGILPIAQSAASAFGRLQRMGGASLTKKIAIKFEDPKDAARVAAAANRTLSSGIDSKRAVQIVANSKDAEQAIRRLNAIRLDEKNLNILEKGGDAAVKKLQQITNHKLSPKDVKIAEHGGPGVIALLNKLMHTNIGPKNFRIQARDLATSIAKSVQAINIRDKRFNIHAEAGQALTAARSVSAAVNAITSKTITITTNHVNKGHGTRGGFSGGFFPFAMGGVKDAMVERAHKEALAHNRRSSGGGRYSTPTLLVGEEHRNEYVIATNPAYRKKNIGHLKAAASDLGVPMVEAAKKGKQPKDPHLSNAGKAKQRKAAQHKLRDKHFHATHYVSDNLAELPKVEEAKRQEDLYARQISINEGQLKEPETFLKVVGTDPETGDSLYAVDPKAVGDWSSALLDIADQYHHLQELITNTKNAVNAAMKKLGDPYKAGFGGITGRAQKNIETLTAQIAAEQKIIDKKHGSNASVDGAKVRQAYYKKLLTNEKDTLSNATTDFKSMRSEQDDVNFRMQDAVNSEAQYRGDAGDVQGKADTAAADANPKAPFVPPPGPFDADQGILSGLDAESALAAIGQGINGQPARDTGAISADQIKTNQDIINTATGLLHDSDPGNDQAAYEAISTAAGAIQQIQQASAPTTDPGATPAAQSMVLSSARGDLMRSFGSNFAAATGIGRASSVGKLGFGAFGVNPAAFGAASGAGGAGGTNVNVVNNFAAPPPDKHTWSQGLAFELQAAV